MADRTGTTIFVTGVNGHVGNHIVRDLLAHGYNVKGSVRNLNDPTKTQLVKAHAAELEANDRLELVEADVLDADPWESLLEGCDGLFHTATVYATKGERAAILETAVKGTTHLLSAAHRAGVPRVIYTSSTAAVGTEPRGRPKTEDDWQRHAGIPYTQAKTDSERRAWSLAEEYGLDLRVINPTAVYGGGFTRPTPSVEFFPEAMRGAYPVAPPFPMSIVHVRDVAKAHRLAFETDGAEGRFVLAPHNGLTLATVCRRIRELNPETKAPRRALPKMFLPIAVFQDWVGGLFGRPRYLTRRLAKSLMRGDSLYSSAKAEQVLGMTWEDFDTCIQDTVDAFR